MKQSIQLNLGQHLTMTPQLQQAIKMLQLSTLDLQQEIQQALDSNMMLETADDDPPAQADGENSVSPGPSENSENPSEEITSEGSNTEMPEELPIDSTWDDVYQNTPLSSDNMGEKPEMDSHRSKTDSLADHLQWQLEMTHFSDRDAAIATAIIDAINEEGYLKTPIEDIFQGLQTQFEELENDEVVAVLHRIQSFDPPGVGAANLEDCLLIQLRQQPLTTPYREMAIELVTRHLHLLASQERAKLIRKLGITEQKLSKVIELIRSLNPRPGNQIQTTTSEYVIPDVFVTKKEGTWFVSLNSDISPKLRINPTYSNLIKRSDSSTDNVNMKNHLQEARWFIKSLQSRNDTLLRVARSIIARQTAFLENGAIAMKPMVLRDIAEELELHESTISRVTTQKYMHTPNGIIEFKYFFSSHVSTSSGGECSATAIRAFIKELVDQENPSKPLSDSKISDLLIEKGINVARRTIAKYREAMSIPPSSQRKRVL